MPLAIKYRTEPAQDEPFEGFAWLADVAPYPIAVPLSLVTSEKRPAHRFMLLLKNLLDAVLRYAALVATSDYLASRSPPSERVNASLADIVRKVPSEGKWLELLRECVSACGATSLVPELGAFLRDAELDRRAQVRVSFPETGLERGWSGKISTWIGLRNALLAHGPSPEDLEQANAEIARLALSVLEAMQPLFSWLLVRRTSPGGPLVLRGPSRERFERYSGTALQAEVFLAHEREDRRFELHPLLVSGLEEEKALPEVGTGNVLLYDHLRSRTVVYRNESMVARMRADKFDALRSALAKRGVELTRPEVEVGTFEELQAASRAQVDRMVQREIDERRYDPTTHLIRERVERHLRTFSEGPAEALFMVGESGCGKSNTLFRYASAQAATGDVVLIARASTLWEKGLPSLTELEEALRREMGIKEGLDRWVQLTSKANEGKPSSERRSVLLIVDQLDSFMGQGRTPWGLFRRLEELVRRHEEGRRLKLLTAIRREFVQDILAETGSEPPLGCARHYQPGDEEKGPVHPSWLLTVGPLSDAEAGQLLESSMRARGLEPARFEDLSKSWRRVLRIPYAVRRYAEACEVLGKPPRFWPSLHKLEKVLHAARAERRQEILMQLVRYCSEHHVADPSVDEILEAGGRLAEAVDEIGIGSDYEWFRGNGLLREDTVRLEDGTTQSRITFAHDRVFVWLYRRYRRAIAVETTWSAVKLLSILAAFVLAAAMIVCGIAVLLPHREFNQLLDSFSEAGPELEVVRRAQNRVSLHCALGILRVSILALLPLAVFVVAAMQVLTWAAALSNRLAKLTPRESLLEFRMRAEAPKRSRSRAFEVKVTSALLAGVALILVALSGADYSSHVVFPVLGAVLIVLAIGLPPLIFAKVARVLYSFVVSLPTDEWRLNCRLAFGRPALFRNMAGALVALCIFVLFTYLVVPIMTDVLDSFFPRFLSHKATAWQDAEDSFRELSRSDPGKETIADFLRLAETSRQDALRKLAQRAWPDSTRLVISLRPYLLVMTGACVVSAAASAALIYSFWRRKLLAELVERRAATGDALG